MARMRWPEHFLHCSIYHMRYTESIFITLYPKLLTPYFFRFLAENIRCKQALMSSGCGQDEVARGLSALSFTRTSRNAGCGVAISMEEDEEYEGM